MQVVSLANGPGAMPRLLAGVRFWMGEHGHESVPQMRAASNALENPEPAAPAHAGSMKVLDGSGR